MIRDMCQEVICLQHEITFDYDKKIDQIDETFHTLYLYEMTSKGMLEHLTYVLNYYFNVVPGFEKEKMFLLKYLNEISN